MKLQVFHYLVSGKPGKCQVPFPTFPPTDLCTSMGLYECAETHHVHHKSLFVSSEIQEELQKWNYTIAQRLFLLNST